MQGDTRVERYMPPIKKAIDKHLGANSAAGTEIYNRAYEAVSLALGNVRLPDDIEKVKKDAMNYWDGLLGRKGA